MRSVARQPQVSAKPTARYVASEHELRCAMLAQGAYIVRTLRLGSNAFRDVD